MSTALGKLDDQTAVADQASKKLRVMIVDDSRVVRTLLTHVLAADPRFDVVASVESGERALQELRRVAPDVISMDIRLPGMNGFEATRRIMSERPTPIVVVAASVDTEDLDISMNALRAGALSVLEKPIAATQQDYERFAQRLCAQLTMMSQVKVLRQRCRRGLPTPKIDRGPAPRRPSSVPRPVAVGVVASTGGPNALLRVLNELPRQMPAYVLLVQHMTPSFMKGFIHWLGNNCSLPVVEAEEGIPPQPGHVYIAPAERHLLLRGRQLHLDARPPVGLQRPSGTLLLESMAAELGSTAAGVVLTGMGDDGARGLQAIHQAGGYTITEDESTAIVYGMPAAAVGLGASLESLPLQAIGPRLRDLLLS